MEKAKETCDVAFEAVLINPYPSEENLENVFDTVSDLLDLVHETRAEIVGKLNGATASVADRNIEICEEALLSTQHYLNTIIQVAKNEKTVE